MNAFIAATGKTRLQKTHKRNEADCLFEIEMQ